MRLFGSAGRQRACLLTVLVAGCASLAIRPCDTIEDRDGKYVGRFFLGVATLGLSAWHAATRDLEPTGRDRPTSSGVQAPVQRGGFQVTDHSPTRNLFC
jgi:hypothetical protein